MILIASSIGAQEKAPKKKDDPAPLPLHFLDADQCIATMFAQGTAPSVLMTYPTFHLVSNSFGWVEIEKEVLPKPKRIASGAIAMLGHAMPHAGATLIQQLSLARIGEYHDCWTLKFKDYVPPLNPKFLAGVRDKRPLPTQPDDPFQMRESLAYIDAVKKTARTQLEAFNKANREQAKREGRRLSYADLITDAKAHRGKIVRVEGVLRLVQKLEANAELKDAGIDHVYNAWLFDKKYHAKGAVLLVTPELPEGIPVGEDFKKRLNKRFEVAFVGYFFKAYLYQHRGSDGKRARLAPMIVGRMIYLNAPKPVVEESGTFSKVLPFLIGFAALGLAIAGALMWWCKRGDDQVRAQIAAARSRAVVEPSEGEEPTTASPRTGDYWASSESSGDPPKNPWDR